MGETCKMHMEPGTHKIHLSGLVSKRITIIPRPESASELYRPSYRILAKLVPTFVEPRDQRDGSLRPYSPFSRPHQSE
jgi:hypothetical protein